jgi:predicted Rdx family selenoprotein
MPPLNFVIEFERELYEDVALALARRLFARFDERIDSLTLVPIPEDDFALYLDGALVRSQRETGEAPRVADVIALIAM